MSTNARIGIFRPETNDVRSVYLHWDGYPEAPGAGQTLLDHYTDEVKVRELIELGNLSSLSEEIGEYVENRRQKEMEAFPEQPYDKWCFSYLRDENGPDSEQPRTHPNDEWPEDYGYIEWEYLFVADTWLGREVDNGGVGLRRAFIRLDALVRSETARVEALR